MDFNILAPQKVILKKVIDYDYLESVENQVVKALDKATKGITNRDLSTLVKRQQQEIVRERIARKERKKLLEKKRIREDAEYREYIEVKREYDKKPYPDRFCLYIFTDSVRFYDILLQEETFSYKGKKRINTLKKSLIKTYSAPYTPILILYFDIPFKEEIHLSTTERKLASKITRSKTITPLINN